MKKIKIKWKICPAPTGRYRSFCKREWPGAYYEAGDPAGSIYCTTSYSFRRVKEKDHSPLQLQVADHSTGPNWKWRYLKGSFSSLKEAKEALTSFLKDHPEFVPEKYK